MSKPAHTIAELPQNAKDKALENIIRQLLSCLGENPERKELKDTPKQTREALQFLTSGYTQNPLDVIDPKRINANSCNDMVIVEEIPIFSHCESHLAPIVGVAYVAYVPSKLTTGIANITRLVDIYARRLQTQERMTQQIAEALEEHLKPVGVAVMLECKHMCMAARGGRNYNISSNSKVFRGCFKNDKTRREEFLLAIK